ncbi:MAG TPA: DUF4058 family protein [Verrucomicrobiales bacterium]|nr:DUF4058 family protein [Verrucomicrobiales bacterium]
MSRAFSPQYERVTGTRGDAPEVYAWSLSDGLPAIRVPLRAPDPDLILDLAALYEETFRRGRYERSLRYGQPLQWTIPPAVSEWIAARARGAPGALPESQ